MKAFAMLPAAVAAILALNISAASSQGGCQQEYQACMDGCAGRSSKGMQDSCFNSCEGRNNLCAERIYGKRPFNGGVSTSAGQGSMAKDALAKNAPAKVENKPEAESAQPQVAAEQVPAPAAEPRAPARRQAR